jgi:hypothetical protein
MKMPGLFKNQAKEQDVKSQNDSNAARFDVDTRIKEMQLAKTQIEIEIQAIKKQKITGAVIPTDSVIPAFKQQNLHMMKSFKYTLDDFVREVALLAGLDNNTIAMLKGKVVASVNNAGDKALNDGIKSIDKIIELYSNARGQGERT